ncbi:hypothetical protein [Syntrophotalea carbinolica]|uniref:hypothetical protein n=1 Tax=Syntrophotalea carbinolica TaxID=19 RepID=UPI00130EC67B|nr:hypothetical protein [Syntrophotalea carbinolica]
MNITLFLRRIGQNAILAVSGIAPGKKLLPIIDGVLSCFRVNSFLCSGELTFCWINVKRPCDYAFLKNQIGTLPNSAGFLKQIALHASAHHNRYAFVGEENGRNKKNPQGNDCR